MNPSDNDLKSTKFVETLRLLGVLDDESIHQVVTEARLTSVSPMTVLGRHGSVSPADIDVVALLLGEKETIPGYQILELVGRGGMGVVFKATQKSLGRLVALKTVFASRSADRTMISRFEQEAATIARLAHPNIVSALDFGRHQGNLYLAMEFVEGKDLGQYIDNKGPLSETTALAIARQIASGLAHASHAGIVHRDVKPANVLLVDAPEGYSLPPGVPMAKLTDFGLALLGPSQNVSARLTSTNAALGSPHYMAPEQFEGKEVDSRADFFALGATLFHMLAGRPPWEGESLNQIVVAKVKGEIPDISEWRNDLQPATRNIVKRLMSRNPSNRPADCDELLEFLGHKNSGRNAVTGMSGWNDHPAMAATQSFDVYRKHRRQMALRRLLVPLAAVAAVLVAAAVLWINPGLWQTDVKLVPGENQVRLFDGITMFTPGLTQRAGGWSAREGRLVHVSGTLGVFQVNLPDWDDWSFETVAENIEYNRIDIQFGSNVTVSNASRFAIRIENGQATLGSLDAEDGRFTAGSEPMKLDVTREAHFVSVARKNGQYEVSIDGMRPGLIPAGPGQHRHVMLVSSRKPESIEDAKQSARFSELVAIELVESGSVKSGQGP